MTDVDGRDVAAWVGRTYEGLAGVLDAEPATWDAPTLCAGWQVRHLVAHVTMPARLSPEQFGAEMAAARGDFGVLSDTVAARDAALPAADLLGALRSPVLHAWQPPGGGATGALSHAVVHSLDVTVALGRPPVAPADAVTAVLDAVTAAEGAWFGVDLAGVRLESSDTGWAWGSGDAVRADGGSLVALLAGRTLPDGRALPRR
ncbi:maleylpyruvate isomerase family mycothiol-dependent enzyme [Geodermatophilus nigrescens]